MNTRCIPLFFYTTLQQSCSSRFESFIVSNCSSIEATVSSMMRSALYYGLRFSVGGHISLSACKVRHNSSLCSKLSVVGGGQMAEAILNSLHANKTQIMENVHVYDIKSERAQYLKSKYGVTVSEDLNQCIADAEILLLAVKPQSLEQLASELTTVPSGMVLSILAGCSIATLQQKFKTKLVMRTMPNTPAMISEGMTVWIASKDTPKSLKEKGQVMLRCIGEEVEVHDEKFVDMATAISGSGPAVSSCIDWLILKE